MPTDAPVIVIVTRVQTATQDLQVAFEQGGYQAVVLDSIRAARSLPGSLTPDLVLLHRPYILLHDLPPSHERSKTLFVSLWPKNGGCTEDQYEEDFDAGVDDILFQLTTRQIVARVRALLRRGQWLVSPPHILTAKGIHMDRDKHEVMVNGKLVSLTPKEFAILQRFLQAPGRSFSRQEMLNQVWGEGYALEEHALDVHIHALRHKIEEDPERPKIVVTVRGIGYKLKL